MLQATHALYAIVTSLSAVVIVLACILKVAEGVEATSVARAPQTGTLQPLPVIRFLTSQLAANA